MSSRGKTKVRDRAVPGEDFMHVKVVEIYNYKWEDK